jgi:uncharacterized protein (TIGR02147 family)
MILNPLNYSDYKIFLKAYIAATQPSRGMVSALADAAGCQRSYFSQVLNSHVQLTPDQAIALAEFMGLNTAKEKYFCLLVDHSRAGTAKLRSRLENEMAAIRREEEMLAARFQTKKVEPGERELFYYSSWLHSAVHVLTTVPDFRTEAAISERLGISIQQLHGALVELEKFNFVKRTGKGWTCGEGDIHVPKTSLLNSVNHSNWRQRAVLDSQNPTATSLHYTSVASMSRDDFENIKSTLLDLIDKSRKIIALSREEDVACMALDFFKI